MYFDTQVAPLFMHSGPRRVKLESKLLIAMRQTNKK